MLAELVRDKASTSSLRVSVAACSPTRGAEDRERPDGENCLVGEEFRVFEEGRIEKLEYSSVCL